MLPWLERAWPVLWAIVGSSRVRRLQQLNEARLDAEDLVRRHGDMAYDIARRLAREQSLTGLGDDLFSPGHWDRVRREIVRALGRVITADGVRYLRPPPSSAIICLACIGWMIPTPSIAQGVPVRALTSSFACRDIGDMIRLALRKAEGDKAGFLAFYNARQDAGACVPLRAGTIGLLQDSHDEQGLHLVCIKQAEDPVCFWSDSPRFEEAP